MSFVRRLLHAHGAHTRLEAARAWLKQRRRDERLLVLSSNAEAASELTRSVVLETGPAFGWQRHSPARLARSIAAPLLAERGLVPAGQLSLEALCARVVHEEHAARRLGRFTPVGDLPGLSRALARTTSELRLAGLTPERLEERDPDLARLVRAVVARLSEQGLADRALVLETALEALVSPSGAHLRSQPMLLLDLAPNALLEERFLAALCADAADCLAVAPTGDEPGLAALSRALKTTPQPLDEGATALASLRRRLFAETDEPPAHPGDAVVLLSAAGEARECVEIARRLHEHARRGVPFDRMAVLLRAPTQYRPLLVEALHRAGIPAWFARGTLRPDPSGRAMLALLACAAEHVSAHRFAEYLSLGEVPSPDASGEPPAPPPPSERFVPPDDELVPEAIAREPIVEEITPPRVPTPRRWEQLIIDARVIGGRDRWARRLQALRRQRLAELRELERTGDVKAERSAKDLESLDALTTFALPLVERLANLPREATWREWIEQLSALAGQALRHPDRIYAALAELAPMASVGPVPLSEVRLVLGRRLAELTQAPPARREGHVFVGPVESARGLAFDVVCVPGLAERLFPQKIVEDPLLRDTVREQLDPALATNETRAASERLALRLAVGAARDVLVLSYPRLDARQGRPRVPSFYGLEVVNAAEGHLPGHEELAERAHREDPTRLGWPAPQEATTAIDEAEHDLALLDELLKKPPEQVAGHARYLLGANPHLARALRFRARRGIRRWTPADGLVEPVPEAMAALQAHHPSARPFSPTALQLYASCPYRFLLYAVHKLQPREEPAPIEDLDPLQYGSLVHEIQYELLSLLRTDGLLPLSPANLDEARLRLDSVVRATSDRFKDELAPSIERVWDDATGRIKSDLVEWLRGLSNDPAWTPARFELSFGLPGRTDRDPGSRDEPVELDVGLRLRGSIDLVEEAPDGSLRATDHKTGKVRAEKNTVIGGGGTLQPVLYALTLEKMFPGVKVRSGRLHYCTTAGGFTPVEIPLDQKARDAARLVATTIGDAIASGFLPAAPDEGACTWCDYKVVCGPDEERRVKRKPRDPLGPLVQLRKSP